MRTQCVRPDNDFPSMRCGHPLPCPYHTVIMDRTNVYSPCGESEATMNKLEAIARIVLHCDDPEDGEL